MDIRQLGLILTFLLHALTFCEALIECTDGFVSRAPVVDNFFAGTRECKLEDVVINGELWAKNAKLSFKNVNVKKNMYLFGCDSVQILGGLTVGLFTQFQCNKATDSIVLPKSTNLGSVLFTGKSLKIYGSTGNLVVNGADIVNLEEGSQVSELEIKFAKKVEVTSSRIGTGGASFNYAPTVRITCTPILGVLKFNRPYDHSPSIGCTKEPMNIKGDIILSKTMKRTSTEFYGINAPTSRLEVEGNYINNLSLKNVTIKSFMTRHLFTLTLSQVNIEEDVFVHDSDKTTIEDSFFRSLEFKKGYEVVLKRNTLRGDVTMNYIRGSVFEDNNNLRLYYDGFNHMGNLKITRNKGGLLNLRRTAGRVEMSDNSQFTLDVRNSVYSTYVIQNNENIAAMFNTNWGSFTFSENENITLEFDTGARNLEISRNTGPSVKVLRTSGDILLQGNTFSTATCTGNSRFQAGSSGNNLGSIDGWCGMNN